MIASVSTSSKIVIEMSTVPVKTAEAIEKVQVEHIYLCQYRSVHKARHLGSSLGGHPDISHNSK